MGEIAEGVAVGKDEHGALGGRDGLFKCFVEGGKFCKIGRRVALIECGIAFVHGAELLLDGGNEHFCVLHGEPDVLVDLVFVLMAVLAALFDALLFGERPLSEGFDEVERAHVLFGVFKERSCPVVRLSARIDEEIGIEDRNFVGGGGLEVVKVGARIFEEGDFDVLSAFCEFAHPIVLREDGADDVELAVGGEVAARGEEERERRQCGEEGAEVLFEFHAAPPARTGRFPLKISRAE